MKPQYSDTPAERLGNSAWTMTLLYIYVDR